MATSPGDDELAELGKAIRDNITSSFRRYDEPIGRATVTDDGFKIAATIRVSEEVMRDAGLLPPLPYVPTHFTPRQRVRRWRQQAKWRVKEYVTHVGRALAGRSCDTEDDWD